MTTKNAFALSLWTTLAGAVSMLAGLAVDATLHTNDHTLVERESIWSLGNPGHLLLAIGIALVVFGITAAVVMHVRESNRATQSSATVPVRQTSSIQL